MADVKMPEFLDCKFDEKGWGHCKKPSTNGWCSEHEDIKCASCGQHGVRSCDAQMGGLGCGATLCDTCQHGRDGDHVTAEVYRTQMEEMSVFERTGQESERMLASRGVPKGLPRNLAELLSTVERQNYTLKTCYYLELKHGLMGTFPAILKDTEVVVLVSEKELILSVWKSLKPNDSRVVPWEYMTDEKVGVAYPMQIGEEQRHSLPLKLFTREEVEKLFVEDKNPFKWETGLIGAQISPERYKELIEKETTA